MTSFQEQRLRCQTLLEECIGGREQWETGKSKIVATTESIFDKRAFLDQVFRDLLLKLLQEERGGDERWQEKLEKFITLSVEWCREQYLTATISVVLLGDVFDALTLDRCEKMFEFVEKRVNVWKEDIFFVACKNNLLRMCNDLLRRLSRSQNTIFCGRILLFLAKFFPFSERSGLNIISEFNLENVTELGTDTSTALDDALSEEEDRDEKDKKNKLTIDYNLYCKFWALQDFFRNPNICYNKVQWKTFASHSHSVLSAFGSYKLEAVQLKDGKNKRRKKSESMDVDSTETHYFAKFLTNQKLLELQLSDTNFRRCVLVQFLILFQYLSSSVKFKLEMYELKSDQVEWVKNTSDLVYKLIGETPPDGKNFANCVKQILKREEHWNTWKNDGCPEFKKLKTFTVPETSEETKPIRKRRKRLLGDIIKDYEEQGKHYLGNSELTKLWNSYPDNLEACKAKERDFLPSLETYLSEAIEQIDTYVQEEDKPDTRVVADGNFGWRALRLLARRSPYFFTHSNHPIHKLTEYLDIMIRKIAKDLPSSDAKKMKQEVVDEEVTEEQMEADLIKQGDPDDVEQSNLERSVDFESEEKSERAPVEKVSEKHIDAVSSKLEADWKKLGTKLGYGADELLFFETSHPTDISRCKNMLSVWADDDEDATVDNLVYILEGLELIEAANALKET